MPTPTSRILRPAQPAKSAKGSIIGSRPYRIRSCATKKSTEPNSPDTSVDPQGRASQYARTWSLTEFMTYPLDALEIPRHALVCLALDNHTFQHFHKASSDLVPSCLLPPQALGVLNQPKPEGRILDGTGRRSEWAVRKTST